MLAALAARTERSTSACWSAASRTATRRCTRRSRRRSTSSPAAARSTASARPGSRTSTTPTASTSRRSKERFERLEDALQDRPRDVHRGAGDRRGHAPPRRGRAQQPAADPRRHPDPRSAAAASGRRCGMVAQYADGCNVFGDPERVRHLLGVLERPLRGRRPRPGGDHARRGSARSSSRRRTRTAEAQLAAARPASGMPAERLGDLIVGDPDEVGRAGAARSSTRASTA